MSTPKVVIIGAGIVGSSLADEITARGWHDVTVLDRGPLFATGGSTSHAPGLVFATNPSATMTAFARYTIDKFSGLKHPDGPCFLPVGGLEIATTSQRWQDLHRKAGWAASRGVRGELIDHDECLRRYPMLNSDRVIGGFLTPDDGLAKALRAVESQAGRAMSRGAQFRGGQEVIEVVERGGRVAGVRTTEGVVAADVVVCAAGFWGAQVGQRAGLTIPLVPMAHQYAYTDAVSPLAAATAEAALPILRHQDGDLYYREHGDRIGIGYYGHRPMPTDLAELPAHAAAPGGTAEDWMPSKLDFTDDDFADAWQDSTSLLPALADSHIVSGFNGIFSFTPDSYSVMGEHRALPGFWVAEAVWVTHSAGVARAMAEWIIDGTPSIDISECDLYRFDEALLTDDAIVEMSSQQFAEVYDIVHPRAQRSSPRDVRTGPFHPRLVEHGAHFVTSGAWERAAWFDGNAALLDTLDISLPDISSREFSDRDEWSTRHTSPITIAEAAWTRQRVAAYDMTSLSRYEISGPGACDFLQRLTSNNVDRPIGTVIYTLLLAENGGIRSDLTVARLAVDRFQVGANGPRDLDWLLRHRPDDGSVTLRDITAATCGIGLWGPLAREVLAPLSAVDVGADGLGYFRCAQTALTAPGESGAQQIPVTLLRVSYVGELGWEIYTDAQYGLALWDLLFAAGAEYGLIPAGRMAMESLRLEKGYRATGVDMTTEHRPAQAGVGFAVSRRKSGFVGADALTNSLPAEAPMLRTLIFDDPAAVVLGKEPVLAGDGGGHGVGYITSAAYSPSLARTLAYAWLPGSVAVGSTVRADYLGTEYTARVVIDPVVDPDGARIRGLGTMVGAAVTGGDRTATVTGGDMTATVTGGDMTATVTGGDRSGSGTTDTMGLDAMG